MKVDCHEGFEAVGPAAWTELHAATALRSPFLTWTWQTEWARAFAAGRRLAIWRVEDEGRLTAVLPLYEAEPGVLRLVGGMDISDYLDVLVRAGQEDAVWSALLHARASAPAVWDLHAVPARSATVTRLPALAEAASVPMSVTVEERCPVLALPAAWEEYLARLSGKHRHELTRKMRRLAREAPDARVTAAASAEEVDRRLGDFVDLHRRSRVGKARFMDDRMEAFFRRAVLAFAAAGGARLWFLDTDAGPMASFITLEWDGTVGLYNSGFHPDRAALAPGVVLLAQVVRDAITRGKRSFDFLRGEERYKYEFEPVAEDVCAVRIG
ncbi:MAG: GNAT family N-acetyltransferase [Candidatus Rokubacteria bacterium]|nr:GNAT family N-acetyltransferase [Candidatus Rokubacteria bacterium]